MKYIVIVRGKLKTADEKQSQAVHDATIAMVGPSGRAMGNIGHRACLNPQDRTQFLHHFFGIVQRAEDTVAVDLQLAAVRFGQAAELALVAPTREGEAGRLPMRVSHSSLATP